MNKTFISLALCAGLLTTAAMARGGSQYAPNNGSSNAVSSSTGNNIGSTSISGLPASELTQADIDGLLFMYEEEKMARDVYHVLGGIWGVSVFSNIEQSEQSHMNAVATLLNKYNIDKPALETTGLFINDEIQALYDALVARGKTSLREALQVGIDIELTDIADLQEKIIGAPADIAAVYQHLLRGSESHLAAFTRLLNNQ